MNDFEVVTHPEALTPGRLGPATGVIWIRVDDFAFPDKQWSDFPEVILAWWLTELHALLVGSTTKGVFRFMDGPFEWSAVASDSWTLGFVDRSLQPRKLPKVIVNPRQVCQQLILAGRRIAELVEARGISGRDSMGLRIALDRLNNVPGSRPETLVVALAFFEEIFFSKSILQTYHEVVGIGYASIVMHNQKHIINITTIVDRRYFLFN